MKISTESFEINSNNILQKMRHLCFVSLSVYCFDWHGFNLGGIPYWYVMWGGLDSIFLNPQKYTKLRSFLDPENMPIVFIVNKN